MRRAARRVVPASGPRHHDDSRHPIASITCRRTPLPVPQPHCRIAAKHPSRAARLAKIALSKTAAPSLRPLQSVSHGRLRRPTHRSQRPPGRQIAIDGNPHAAHRGFLPWRLSDAGPQCPLLDCERAGIRNPSHHTNSAELMPRVCSGSSPAACPLRDERPELTRKRAFGAAGVNCRTGWRADLCRSRGEQRGCADSSHAADTTVARPGALFDYFIRPCEQGLRYVETEILRRLEIDEQFEFGR